MKNLIKKLATLMTMAVVILSFTACGPKIDPPETVVDKALTAIKAQDYDTASVYFDSDPEEALGNEEKDGTEQDEDELSDQAMTKLMNNLQYTIVSTEVKDNTAIVKTKIKNIDMSVVISDYINQAFQFIFAGLSEDELEAKFNEILLSSMDSHSTDLIEKEIDIALTKGENGWIITMDEPLVDAITGGMITIANNLNAE